MILRERSSWLAPRLGAVVRVPVIASAFHVGVVVVFATALVSAVAPLAPVVAPAPVTRATVRVVAWVVVYL